MSISQNFPDEGPTLNLNFAGSKVLDPRITFSRPSTSGDATYMDANGLIVTAAADEPRFDHRYVNGEIESMGLLVEEQRTNLTTYSTDFSSSYSVANGSITTNQTTSPSGENNAALLTQTSTSTAYLWKSFSWTSGTKYTFSCYVKKYSASDENDVYILGYNTTFSSSGSSGDNSVVIFNLDDLTSTTAAGDVDGHSIIDAGNGWRRISATFTAYATETKSAQLLRFTDPNQTSYMYMWGYQIETGAFPTSYIPTTSSTATRSADSVTMTGTNFSDWYNPTEGTVYTELSLVDVGNSGGKVLWNINRVGGFGEGFYMVNENNGTSLAYNTFYGSSNQAQHVSSGITTNQYYKTIFSYQENNVNACFDGNVGTTDTSVGIATVGRLTIGNNAWGNTLNPGDCHIKSFTYYPTRLSNTVLQNLTK